MKTKASILMILLLCLPNVVYGQEVKIIGNEENEIINNQEFAINLLDNTFIDWNKLETLISKFEKQTKVPPKNAFLNKQGIVIPEKAGKRLNHDLFKKLLISSFYKTSIDTIEIPTFRTYPKVDSELLSEIKVNELGSYETSFQEKNKERTINVNLATKAINNSVVFPNQTFSFNDVVGKRTVQKGYQMAPVIIDGEMAEDIGGGICQVSSTLFNAVNLQGIDIVERYSHSRKVPYVPPGKDATVSWWGPDFVFRNKLSHPILIRATSKNGKMLIKLYSSNQVTTT